MRRWFADWRQGVPCDEKIPTLEELMLAAKGKPILINLDKSWTCLRETYEVLKRTGTVQQGIFKGPEPLDSLRKKYGSLMDSITYMPVVWPVETEQAGKRPETPKAYTGNFIRLYHPAAYEMVIDSEDSPVLTEALPAVKAAHATVWINTLWDNLCAGHIDDKALSNPDANWGWAIEQGANVIQTDRIAELLAYLRKRGMHK